MLEDAAGLRALKPAAPMEGVIADHLRALRFLMAEAGDSVDVIHTIFSPLAVTAQLTGSDARFRELAESDVGAAHAAIAVVTETISGYARAAVDMGASGIFFAPLLWASRDHSDQEFYAEFGRPYDMEVLRVVSDAPFNVLHVCRNNNMIDVLLDYPVAAFNWADRGAGNPSLAEIRARTDKAVMGGIDHSRLHQMSTEDVTQQVRDALSQGTHRVLIGGGCAIPPTTPNANRAAVTAAARAFGP
jgi:uroporphyrinogen decarboxylase